MKVTDSTRIALLEALLKKSSVQPNIRQIQKHTDYHKATIKSSLEFLKKAPQEVVEKEKKKKIELELHKEKLNKWLKEIR